MFSDELLLFFDLDFDGENDCIPSCNEVAYKITSTTSAKFPGTEVTSAGYSKFTTAAENLVSDLTKNLNDNYKKYFQS